MPAAKFQSDWDALVSSKPWKWLRLQQRVFVTAFIANGGDALAAVRIAYPDAKEKSQVCMSYNVPNSPRITDALEFWNRQQAA